MDAWGAWLGKFLRKGAPPPNSRPEADFQALRPIWPASLRGRDTALDALRTLAVLLMFASHTTRLIAWDARRDWGRFSLLIEPLTASLFLFLVGSSLVHSWRRRSGPGRAAWFRKQGLRAAGLFVLSGLFYTLQEGFHWPDAVLLSGILATIAYAIVTGMLLVGSSRPVLFLVLAAMAMAAGHLWTDALGIRLFMLNAGNSPFLPLLLFASLGALSALALESRNLWVRPACLAAALLALGLLLHVFSFEELFSKPVGRFETTRVIFAGPPQARLEKTIPYYNLRPILVPAILSLIVLLYAGLALLRPWLDKAARLLLPLGRHSLDVYILHLAMLAVLVVAGGKRPLTRTWQGDAALAGVILVCYAWALGRDLFRARRESVGKRIKE